MNRKFKTNYNSTEFPKKFDAVGGEDMVERAGYISAKTRIENMILAGQRLTAMREDMYDTNGEAFMDDGEDIPIDPTRNGKYDLADASQDTLGLSRRIQERARNKKLQEKEVKKDSQDGHGNVVPPVDDSKK